MVALTCFWCSILT